MPDHPPRCADATIAPLADPAAAQPSWPAVMGAVSRGDVDQFDRIVAQWWRKLAGYFKRQFGFDNDSAADLAQDTLLRILKYAHRYDGRPYEPWLFTIAYRVGLDAVQRRQRR